MTETLDAIRASLPEDRHPIWMPASCIFTEARKRGMSDREIRDTLNNMHLQKSIKVHNGLNEKIIEYKTTKRAGD